jgi:hypothetical protein
MVGVGVAVGANQQQRNAMQHELTAITKAVVSLINGFSSFFTMGRSSYDSFFLHEV